jgi:predicted DNA-binding transcriptional regulator YafY
MGQGRDQLAPMERLTQILSLLSTAPTRTQSADQILAVVPYGADTQEDRRDQLRRDVRHLEALGWEIVNVADPGDPARYRLTAVDNRLRVEFTPSQRYELVRAAHAARLAELVDGLGGDQPQPETEFEASVQREDSALSRVQRAVARHCLLRFRYRDRDRVVHPHALHARPGGWYLTGNEDGVTEVKTFVVSRMSDVRLDAPGTAATPDRTSRPQLDPITWTIDPAVDVVIETTPEHRPQVESMLGRATRAETSDPATVRLTIPVTHRAAFRRRLYELGTRVRLLGPIEVRDEVRRELLAVAEGAV